MGDRRDRTCTWSVKIPAHGKEVWGPCEEDARVVFSRTIHMMGRYIEQRFPRCHKHSPGAVVKAAREQGFVVTWLEDSP